MKAERLVGSRWKELAALDDEFFGEMVGVAEAIASLRKALSQLSAALDARQFEKASALGYGKVAEEFVFLQRTLGGLQGASLHKEGLVQNLAFALRCPYEDVLPKVDALLASARPVDRKQRAANRKAAAPRIRAAIEALTQKFGGRTETGTVRTRRRGGRKRRRSASATSSGMRPRRERIFGSTRIVQRGRHLFPRCRSLHRSGQGLSRPIHPDWSLAPASGTLRGVRRSWRPHPNHHRQKGSPAQRKGYENGP